MSGRLDGKVCPQDVWVSARDGLWHFDGMCLPVRLRRAVKFIIQRKRGASDRYRIEGRDRKAGRSHIPLPACAANGHDSIVLRFARSSECSGLLSSKNQP